MIRKYKVVQTFSLGVPVYKLKRRYLFIWFTIVNTTGWMDIAHTLRGAGYTGDLLVINKTLMPGSNTVKV